MLKSYGVERAAITRENISRLYMREDEGCIGIYCHNCTLDKLEAKNVCIDLFRFKAFNNITFKII